MTNFLTPTNKLRWQKAVRSKAKSVQLEDGRTFQINYERMSSNVTDETWDVIRFRGPNVQDPSGYMRIGTMLTDEWIITDDFKLDTLYEGYLKDFLKSNEKGVDVKEEWPDLANRQRESIRRGFNNAILALGRRARKVKVMTQAENVYLIKDD